MDLVTEESGDFPKEATAETNCKSWTKSSSVSAFVNEIPWDTEMLLHLCVAYGGFCVEDSFEQLLYTQYGSGGSMRKFADSYNK